MVCWDIRVVIQALGCFSWPVYPWMVATCIILVCPDRLDSGDWMRSAESPSEAVGARGFVATSEHIVAGSLGRILPLVADGFLPLTQ
jgi:hypothetical protein